MTDDFTKAFGGPAGGGMSQSLTVTQAPGRDMLAERKLRGDMNVKEGRNRIGKKKQLDLLVSEEQIETWRKIEFFPTPPWAVRAVMEALSSIGYDFEGHAFYDPCAGRGHLATPLKQMGHTVYVSDIYDHGLGHTLANALDFEPKVSPAVMFTNPPFSGEEGDMAEKIIRRAQEYCDHVIIICRQGFLNSTGRHALHCQNDRGNLTTFMPFCERVPMVLGYYDPKISTATEYAAFHYERGFKGVAPTIHIPPGSKVKHFRPDDVTI